MLAHPATSPSSAFLLALVRLDGLGDLWLGHGWLVHRYGRLDPAVGAFVEPLVLLVLDELKVVIHHLLLLHLREDLHEVGLFEVGHLGGCHDDPCLAGLLVGLGALVLDSSVRIRALRRVLDLRSRWQVGRRGLREALRRWLDFDPLREHRHMGVVDNLWLREVAEVQ